MRRAALLPFLLVACGETSEPQETTVPAQSDIAAQAPASTGIADDVAAEIGGVTFRFAGQDAGGEVLARRDEYTAELQPREIAIRAQDAGASDWQAVADAYRADVMTWTDDQKAAMRDALSDLEERIAIVAPLLPEEVLLVLAGQVVEGGLPHTRSNAIIFAGGQIPLQENSLKGLILHELHHVLSRKESGLQDDYFALIGYEPCRFEEPEALRAVRLTNPDAPVNRHFVPVEMEGADGVIPFLHTTRDYDGEGRLPDYFGFGLLPVTVEAGTCTAAAETTGDLLEPQDVPAFMQAIGGNTGYVIHPEETLSDNFTFWMMEVENRPNPEIIEAVGAFWKEQAAD
jgi:hypothetical protein